MRTPSEEVRHYPFRVLALGFGRSFFVDVYAVDAKSAEQLVRAEFGRVFVSTFPLKGAFHRAND